MLLSVSQVVIAMNSLSDGITQVPRQIGIAHSWFKIHSLSGRNIPMNWYSYGHDFGNAEIGGVLSYKEQTLSRSIPTAFTKVDTAAMKSLGVQMDNSYVIRLYGEETAYAVGELALQQTIDSYNGRGDMQRYASHFSLRGLLTVVGSLIPDAMFGLYVVTGLPAETYIKNIALRSDI